MKAFLVQNAPDFEFTLSKDLEIISDPVKKEEDFDLTIFELPEPEPKNLSRISIPSSSSNLTPTIDRLNMNSLLTSTTADPKILKTLNEKCSSCSGDGHKTRANLKCPNHRSKI
jgi:hypothetical protein